MDVYDVLMSLNAWGKRVRIYKGKHVYYIGSTDEMSDSMLDKPVKKYLSKKYETVIYLGYASQTETIVLPGRKDVEQARAALQIKSKLFVVVDSVETTGENRRMTVEAFKANSEVY